MKHIILFSLLTFFCAMMCHGQRREIQQRLDSLANAANAKVGIAIVTGDSVIAEVNGDVPFPLSSVFKFPLAMAVLDSLQKACKPASMTTEILRSEILHDTWSPMRNKYPSGDISLPVGELIDFAMTQSDNNAADILLSRFGGCETVNRFLHTAGCDTARLHVHATEAEMHADPKKAYRNLGTPVECARLALHLVDRPLLKGWNRRWLIRLMTECATGTERLPKHLKDKVFMLGHKTGTGFEDNKGRITGVNDMGFIIPFNGNPIGIAVYVTDAAMPLQEAEHIIAEAGRILSSELPPL
ncbi:MAG: class A beta-lactamase [Bacteroidales bacterium]|nr:class A beta-lactamase [Bacteroidales bacterium]MCM1146275.1 class A beta-lactamase [Bacteroidales bacterium]MCM1205287.1 class A beta-lactamase [Bacillota bacterium]MCM1509626.1 class A beta-lactamase [Clostridium sp.]